MAVNKKIVKRIVFTTLWSLLSAVAVMLLIAATRERQDKVCSNVEVHIKSIDGIQYISEKNILNTISGGAPANLKGQLIKTFDLQQLEELLEQNLWIRNAELFFDNEDVLQVDITERQPVARVFALSGETFYVDDLGEQLPTTIDQVARVPVFTSFPVVTRPLTGRDSLLLQQVKDVGIYMIKNDFWMAQIDQVNINNYEMEMIPKLGKHIIQFGEGINVEVKFKRLLLFYKQIMNKTGWNYYSSLNVSYEKQLVAMRRDSASLFKSFAISKNENVIINEIIDSLQIARDTALSMIKTDSSLERTVKTSIQHPKTVPVKTQSNPSSLPVKNSVPVPLKKPEIKKGNEEKILKEANKQTERKPKAVMEKKNEQ